MNGRRARQCQVTTDPDAQALYVRVGRGRVASTRETPVTCNVDLDEDGHPVGIELLGLAVDFTLQPEITVNITSAPPEVRIVPVPVWRPDRWHR